MDAGNGCAGQGRGYRGNDSGTCSRNFLLVKQLVNPDRTALSVAFATGKVTVTIAGFAIIRPDGMLCHKLRVALFPKLVLHEKGVELTRIKALVVK